MSDHPNPNIHRGDAIGGRGLLIALVALLGIVVLLGVLGGGGGDVTGDAVVPGLAPAEAPVADAAQVAPVGTD